MSDLQDKNITRSVPAWMLRIGIQSWLFIGIVLAAAVILAFLATIDKIVGPIIISLLFAILSRPLVDWLEHHKVSRSLGTVLTMILMIIGMVSLVVIVVQGLVRQAPEIALQLQRGWEHLDVSFSQFNINLPAVQEFNSAVVNSLPVIFEGIFGFFSSTVSTTIALFMGLYFSLFILFFFLRDTEEIENWISHRISLKPQVGTKIVKDAGQTVLVYFRGTALTALITSVVIAVPLMVLNIPLIGSILILYFFTSFIPYLGAWIAGAFAVLIALGAGGMQYALIILIAVMLSNGILQSVVSSWALGSMLKVHPLVIFLVTIIAGMLGGILLMILAVPLTVIVIQVGNQLHSEGVFSTG